MPGTARVLGITVRADLVKRARRSQDSPLDPVLGSSAKKAWAAALGPEDERAQAHLVREALRTAVESDEHLASLPPDDQVHAVSVLSHALAELDEGTLTRLGDESEDSVTAVLAGAARSPGLTSAPSVSTPFLDQSLPRRPSGACAGRGQASRVALLR